MNEIVVNIDIFYLVPVQCFAGYYHIKCDHLSGITVNPAWGGGGPKVRFRFCKHWMFVLFLFWK